MVDQPRARTLPVMLAVVLAVSTAQQALGPVLPPLARELGLAEIALGAVITISAATLTATSLLWGRAVDRYGHRRVLLIGIGLACAGLLGFALVGQIALNRDLSPGLTFGLMVATRSLLFGAGLGAVPVAAISLVAATTADEGTRTRGIGQVGAVQGVAIALGPALGALLGFAGILGPVWAAPAVVLVALVLVVLLVPAPAGANRVVGGDTEPGAHVSLRPWDPRLWPVLVAGFGLYLTLGMVLIIVGFLVQDRLRLDSAETVTAAGIAAFVAGVVLILVQGLLVPRLSWPAARLLRFGAPATAAGVAVLLVAPSLVSIVAGLAVMALGLGLAAPGFATTPTLLVGPSEQGSVAGLTQTVVGLTFMIGPITGTGLYGVWSALPMIVALGAALAATAFVWLHPAFRRVAVSASA